MYTSEQIDQIMEELGFEPGNADANQMRQVVEQIANSKPAVSIDSEFISRLRNDLQQRAAESMRETSTPQYTYQKPSNNLFAMFMKRALVSGLIVIAVVVAGGIWYNQNSSHPLFQLPNSSSGQLLSGKYDVKSVAQESFGDLDKVAIVNANDAAKLNNGGNNPAAAQGRPEGGMGIGLGGGPISSLPSSSPSTPAGVNTTQPDPAPDKMIAPGEPYPGAVYYSFKYAGEQILPGLADTQPVLKRTKPQQPASLVSRILNLISFGLIDLNKMQNVQMQNFSFIEDREFGYGAYVDLQQGNVGMYQNYEKWPQLFSQDVAENSMCIKNGCPTPKPLQPSDLLPNNEAISIADEFLKEYAVSKEGYGQPRVEESWRIGYDQASESDRPNYYIPEQMQVLYPLTLEGKEVLDESGMTYGMSVTVDVRTKRVTNLNELITKQFERSEYKGEIDSKRILDIAERGGFRNYNYEDSNAKKVELDLGTPSVQMIKIYYSSDNYRTNSDLYMPALVFPINNWEKAKYWRKSVIVPLVKSILDTDQQQPYQIMGKPMPVDSGPGTGASSSNSGASSPSTSNIEFFEKPAQKQ